MTYPINAVSDAVSSPAFITVKYAARLGHIANAPR